MVRLVSVLMSLAVAGCVSPYLESGGTFLVTKHTEQRSPFGTNGGFDLLERCQGPERVLLFYLERDFTECQLVPASDPVYALLHHKQSKGQGGEVVGALINGAALGGVAAAASGAGSTISSTASASASAVAAPIIHGKGPRGHR